MRNARPISFSLFAILLCLHSLPTRAATLAHFWSRGFGATGFDYGYSTAVDPTGSVFIAGSFAGSVDFGGGPLTTPGQAGFIAKYTPSGGHLWSKRLGTGDSGQDAAARAVAVDASGSVIVVGPFSGTADFGGGPLVSAGFWDIFVVKYAANGAHVWSSRFGGVSSDQPSGVTVDGSANVLVTGWFYGTVDFGGGPLVSAAADIFVLKLDANGAHQWSRSAGAADGMTSQRGGIAADAAGNVVITGAFWTTVDFGGGPLVSVGAEDIFVAQYNSSGVHQWSRRFGSGVTDYGEEIAVDATGNVFVTGAFSGTVEFGGGLPLVSAGFPDIFLAKYSSSGAHQWSQRFGGTVIDAGHGLAVDASNHILITGECTATVDFGGGPLPGAAGDQDIFAARYDTNGLHHWSARFGGGAGSDWGNGIAADASGSVFLTGIFAGTVDFGGGPLTSAGVWDIFLVKFGPFEPSAAITSIEDVGNDQGRQAIISFARSDHDQAGQIAIEQYEAFRRIDPLPAPPADAPIMQAEGWTFVGAVPAHHETEYSIVVPTQADSTITDGVHYSAFFIRASTANPGVFYDSAVDSGYSVDNLAPSAPANLAYAGGALTWRESKDADFDYFSVYGSASAAFDASAVLVENTTGVSLNVTSTPHVFYYVTATDFSGNEGRASRVNTASSVEGPAAYALSVNAYPNPFNPGTTIRYDVPSRGRVVVSVYNAAGARVTTLVETERDAGSYSVRWEGTDARGVRASSGVYFVRVEFGNESKSKKIVLLK